MSSSSYTEFDLDASRFRLSRQQWISLVLFVVGFLGFEIYISYISIDLLFPSFQTFLTMALLVSGGSILSSVFSMVEAFHIENKRFATLMFNMAFGAFAIWIIFMNQIGIWSVGFPLLSIEIRTIFCWIAMILGFFVVVVFDNIISSWLESRN